MKYKISTAALIYVTFVTVSHAQSSVTLYGLIDAGITYVRGGDENAWQMRSGAVNGSRWGLRGSEDLGGGLKAIFTLENGFSITNGSASQSGRMFGRQAFVGVASDRYGALTLGRQYDSVVDYLAPLSITGTQFGGTTAAHPFDNDNLNNSIRFNNTVKYASIDYAGLRFGATYSFSNSTEFANNRAYSFGASYVWSGFTVAAGYLQLNNDITSTVFSNNGPSSSASGAQTGEWTFLAGRQRTFGGGLSYVYGPLTAGLVYTQTNLSDALGGGVSSGASGTSAGIAFRANSARFQNFEGNVRYALTPAITLAAAYTYTRSDFGGGVAPIFNTVSAQADYVVSKRTDVYLQGNYQHVSRNFGNVPAYLNGLPATSNTTPEKQGAVTIGMRHRF
ncbi:Porin, GBP family [Paraburkholderia tropica]|uniref:porin n=1 Tax=Paraburkholderia tropica TaxID=92647 RepID=UPI001CB45D87|nr:porin [Paraburkholderia tropica]CAG9216707.1 Porin, GBP family [Paraburkholderia tropica]